MVRSDAVCADGLYYCYPLGEASERDLADIGRFEPIDDNGVGLAHYLRERALEDESAGTMRTYLVRDQETEEFVGFFSLKAGLVSLGESANGDHADFDTVPGVEMANFALDGTYRRSHPASKGCGMVIFTNLVRELVRRASEVIGIYVLYIYSLPFGKVMDNYGRYGFRRLPAEDERMLHARLKPRYDAQCIFMYMLVS